MTSNVYDVKYSPQHGLDWREVVGLERVAIMGAAARARVRGMTGTPTQRLLSIQPHLAQSSRLRLNPLVSWTS